MLSVLVASLLPLAAAQSVQQSWIAPSMPDLSTTITEGVPFTLTWDNTLQNWFGSYAPEAVTTNVTLWIAAMQLPYAHIIQQFVDVTRTRQITWTPSLPPDEYANETNWSFRFTPSNITDLNQPGASSEEIDSPQIKYQGPAASMSATSSTASSTASATGTGTTSSPTTSAPPMNMTTGLSKGAIAGIAVGSILGAAIAFLLIVVLWRLRRTNKALHQQRGQSQIFGPPSENMSSVYHPGSASPPPESVRPYFSHLNAEAELPPHEQATELEAHERWEMDGGKEKKGEVGEMEGK